MVAKSEVIKRKLKEIERQQRHPESGICSMEASDDDLYEMKGANNNTDKNDNNKMKDDSIFSRQSSFQYLEHAANKKRQVVRTASESSEFNIDPAIINPPVHVTIHEGQVVGEEEQV